jgi:hypothetical protein
MDPVRLLRAISGSSRGIIETTEMYLLRTPINPLDVSLKTLQSRQSIEQKLAPLQSSAFIF